MKKIQLTAAVFGLFCALQIGAMAPKVERHPAKRLEDAIEALDYEAFEKILNENPEVLTLRYGFSKTPLLNFALLGIDKTIPDAEAKRDKIVKKLLTFEQVDPSDWNRGPFTDDVPPLSAALGHRSPTLVKMLLDAGANPNVASGRFPERNLLSQAIHIGILDKDKDLVLLDALLEKADPNYKGYYSDRAIFTAIDKKNMAAVQKLLDAGVDVTVYSDGLPARTPVGLAQRLGLKDIAKLLKEKFREQTEAKIMAKAKEVA